MSAGDFAGLLVQTAVIFRRQETTPGVQKVDRFGQPTRDEQEHHRLPCRITGARGGEQFGERSHDVVVTNHELFLDRGADLREDDVITVLGVEGEEIVTRAEVTLVRPVYDAEREHHREAMVSTQREAR